MSEEKKLTEQELAEAQGGLQAARGRMQPWFKDGVSPTQAEEIEVDPTLGQSAQQRSKVCHPWRAPRPDLRSSSAKASTEIIFSIRCSVVSFRFSRKSVRSTSFL